MAAVHASDGSRVDRSSLVATRGPDVPCAAMASATGGLNMTRVDDRRVEGLGALRFRLRGVDEGLKTDFGALLTG